MRLRKPLKWSEKDQEGGPRAPFFSYPVVHFYAALLVRF